MPILTISPTPEHFVPISPTSCKNPGHAYPCTGVFRVRRREGGARALASIRNRCSLLRIIPCRFDAANGWQHSGAWTNRQSPRNRAATALTARGWPLSGTKTAPPFRIGSTRRCRPSAMKRTLADRRPRPRPSRRQSHRPAVYRRHAGILLYATLEKFGFASGEYAASPRTACGSKIA